MCNVLSVYCCLLCRVFLFFKQMTAYEMRISDWSSDVCSSDLPGPRGALCFQAIVDDNGDASVFEINARFGGGYPLAHRAGAAFGRWLMEERLQLPSSANDDWRNGVTMLRYDAAVFIDS